jgi:hypothetical protein
MAHEFSTSYIADSTALFLYYKGLGERAIQQLTDAELFEALDSEGNSVAVIVKHIAGNMRSRWTDFLTTDGEKPDRNRDTEFEPDVTNSRDQLMARWEAGWKILFDALAPLSDDQLATKVFIRSEPHSVTQAINRQIAHYAYHVGQIVFLAKHFRASEWKTLSVPRGKSVEFTKAVSEGKASQR